MTVLWLCYPRFRIVYAVAMAAVAVGLVGADFHFIGDVIAGGFLGVSAGWFTVVIWELGLHRVRGDQPAAPATSPENEKAPAKPGLVRS
jgi:membrane-associated phospholipid phosphatase